LKKAESQGRRWKPLTKEHALLRKPRRMSGMRGALFRGRKTATQKKHFLLLLFFSLKSTPATQPRMLWTKKSKSKKINQILKRKDFQQKLDNLAQRVN
jgi:hypothetical protein